jgi:hypothetical protein
MAMNFAEIQTKKMIDMQELADAQQASLLMNNQMHDNSTPS